MKVIIKIIADIGEMSLNEFRELAKDEPMTAALIVKIEKHTVREYRSMADLLAGYERQPRTEEDEAWLNDPPVGREII